ncbi:hypothetical protein JQK88_16180 [Mesorhizobium caraganae]|uniref:hypothetical protein n=1 Tax=Mesorhizobium caraganae TaxID=483206 RepID=UPI001939D764|nr:hypothetical protein [Mesorhizobium caraganae]MBM2712754.1 hypothetical protein [Mesorhizobium caraganae]
MNRAAPNAALLSGDPNGAEATSNPSAVLAKIFGRRVIAILHGIPSLSKLALPHSFPSDLKWRGARRINEERLRESAAMQLRVASAP